VLGANQDAVVAVRQLRELAQRTDRTDAALIAGRMIEVQLSRKRSARRKLKKTCAGSTVAEDAPRPEGARVWNPGNGEPGRAMRLQPATKLKLEVGKERLAAEFTSVPEDEIAGAVDRVAVRLVDVARFDDFVPVLAERRVRDVLLDQRAA
jgi:hypothetical protein